MSNIEVSFGREQERRSNNEKFTLLHFLIYIQDVL